MLRLEDGQFASEADRAAANGASATILQDLGLITDRAAPGAPNFASNARVQGGSMFDKIIALRNDLYKGDVKSIGGQDLGGIDNALSNMGARLADLGSRSERVQATWKTLNTQIPNTQESLDREAGLDMADAAVQLNMFDMAHKAAMQATGRLLPQTLLDFLR
jgi:flagellar hook-associated protein 3 FlgL